MGPFLNFRNAFPFPFPVEKRNAFPFPFLEKKNDSFFHSFSILFFPKKVEKIDPKNWLYFIMGLD